MITPELPPVTRGHETAEFELTVSQIIAPNNAVADRGDITPDLLWACRWRLAKHQHFGGRPGIGQSIANPALQAASN